MALKDFYEDKKFIQSRIPFIQAAAVTGWFVEFAIAQE